MFIQRSSSIVDSCADYAELRQITVIKMPDRNFVPHKQGYALDL